MVKYKIIWLNKGKLYEFSKDNDILALKAYVTELEPVGAIEISLPILLSGGLTERITMGANSLDARYQHEFRGNYKRDCSGTLTGMGNSNYKFKYVHEIYTVQIYIHKYMRGSELWLRTKMEYKFKRKSWKKAGEKRDITLALNTSNITLRNNGVVIPISGYNSVNQTFNCVNDKSIRLKYTPLSYDIYWNGNRVSWDISIQGTITHQIHGGYNRWINYVNW